MRSFVFRWSAPCCGTACSSRGTRIGSTADRVDRFPDRKRTKTIDGVAVAGWFTEDFTPAEIGTLEREGATEVSVVRVGRQSFETNLRELRPVRWLHRPFAPCTVGVDNA